MAQHITLTHLESAYLLMLVGHKRNDALELLRVIRQQPRQLYSAELTPHSRA